MFIREKKGTYKGKTYINYQLVESVRTPQGPRQKVVCSLGNLKPRPWQEWLKLAYKLETALVGQMDLFEEDDQEVIEIVRRIRSTEGSKLTTASAEGQEDGDEVVAVRVNEAGPVHVGYQYWKKLGFDEILSRVGLDERARTLTCLMTMNRLFSPTSENAMPNRLRQTALGDILGIDLEQLGKDTLYRNLDLLHPHRQAIETHLAEQERALFNLDQTIFFYDLTSTYFEVSRDRSRKPSLCTRETNGRIVNRC